nr:MAG TPA: hypothetical protein [Caudoviricetes sp.]DAK64242.1 MAG TPA: hypothetical protein [Caudoviricetes sp.]
MGTSQYEPFKAVLILNHTLYTLIALSFKIGLYI